MSVKNKKKKRASVETEPLNPSASQAGTDSQPEIHSQGIDATSQDDQAIQDESLSRDGVESEPVRVHFPYSDVVRSYVPEAMAIADKALGDWKTEGSFMNLGIENPYANMAVSLSLQNAKKIEKKLEEKGVLPVVRMGFEVLKSKVIKSK